MQRVLSKFLIHFQGFVCDPAPGAGGGGDYRSLHSLWISAPITQQEPFKSSLHLHVIPSPVSQYCTKIIFGRLDLKRKIQPCLVGSALPKNLEKQGCDLAFEDRITTKSEALDPSDQLRWIALVARNGQNVAGATLGEVGP